MKASIPETKTLVVNNFGGRMTAFQNGDINSGWTDVFTQFGDNQFRLPGQLTWSDGAVQIDPDGEVITDLIFAAKERVESGILYVYAIGHTGRLYKIQVNDPTTYNPDYDNPILLATLTAQSPTFTRGGFMDFYGSTEQIWIGHDKGVTRINFDGTGETFVGGTGVNQWVQNVPRPLQQFIGKLFVGNGENIAEIDTTNLVTSYARLAPGFPSGSQARDMDVTPEGDYLQITVSRLALGDMTSPTQDTSYTSNSGSFIFKWNGTDDGYTSFYSFPAFSLSANTIFQNKNYTFGYDMRGGAVFDPLNKIITDAFNEAPLPNAIISDGNVLAWICNFYFNGQLDMLYLQIGNLDFEVEWGYWCPFGQTAQGDETDVVRLPMLTPVSNFGQGISNNGYTENIFSTSKVYFSTLETSVSTTKYKLYKWFPRTTGTGVPIIDATYQTQKQLFSEKVLLQEVRVYGQPWQAGVSFRVSLIGSDNEPIPGSEKEFTAGTSLTVGADFAWYKPTCSPTYAVGLRVENLGEVNHVISKVEIDYVSGGK